ncbi:MAG: glycosyl hydrolase family 28-related protein, partial [Cyanobacteria bacterium J06635_1]
MRYSDSSLIDTSNLKPTSTGIDMLDYIVEDIQDSLSKAKVMAVAAVSKQSGLITPRSVDFDAYKIYGKAPTEFGDAAEIVFPDDPAIVINVRDFGAQGDGIADDTQAIQNAIYAAGESRRALYFPNGTYRVTQEIRFENANGGSLNIGPHLYGQSQAGVVLKLDDNAAGFQDPDNPKRAVIRAINVEDGTDFRSVSADFFNRYLINFTIDTGNNPGATGIKFYSNNTGILRNVRIIGDGSIGLDLNAVDLNGP